MDDKTKIFYKGTFYKGTERLHDETYGTVAAVDTKVIGSAR